MKPIYYWHDFENIVRRGPEKFFIVHYSCENLFEQETGISPRVTSIAIRHFSTHQNISFSLHLVAEERKFALSEIKNNLDELEREMLKRFFDFIATRGADAYWLHWRMSSITFGFDHIAHRWRVLGGTEVANVKVENRVDLTDVLYRKYGPDFADAPTMPSLMKMNGWENRHTLTGEQEVSHFKQGKYALLHESTLSKVKFFGYVAEQMLSGRLKTKSRRIAYLVDKIFNHFWVRALGMVTMVLSFGLGIAKLASWLITGRF